MSRSLDAQRSGSRRASHVRTIVVLALIALSTISVATSQVVLFGPVTYLRQTTKPETATSSFAVQGPLRTAKLQVWNYGNASAIITINSNTVITTSDFSGSQPNGFLIERPLSLLTGTNTITVDLRSKPGSSIVVQIVGEYLPRVSDLRPAQLTIGAGGGTGFLTVDIQNPDLSNAMHVTLASADKTVAAVPPEVVVPSGASSATFTVTGGASGGPVAITASLNGTSATSEVVVRARPAPPVLTQPLVDGAIVVGGSGLANALVDVFINDVMAGIVTTSADGHFSLPVSPLRAGQIITATESVDGLTSALSAPVTVRARPPAPTVTAPLVAGSQQIGGTASANAAITVFVEAAIAGTGTAAGDGRFNIGVAALVVGQHVTATQTVASVESIPSAPVTVVALPAPPAITTPLIDGTAVVTGSALATATVETFVDGVSVGSASVNGAGTWTLNLASSLSAGQRVKARQKVAGVTSAFSAEVVVLARPSPPHINVPLVEGMTSTSGTGITGATVRVLVDAATVGTTAVGGNGTWTLDIVAALVAGQSVTALQTATGIDSDPSAPVIVLARPVPPIVSGPLVDGTTTVSGVGISGATLELFVNGVSAGSTTITNASWTLTLSTALTTGQLVKARQTVAGLTSNFSDPLTVMARPPAPNVDRPLFAGALTLSGTGIPGASIEAFANGLSVGTTAVGTSGTWTLTLTSPLVAGQLITAQQTVAGITSDRSAPIVVQAGLVAIDITPAPTASVTKGDHVLFSARGRYSDGSMVDPLVGVTWSSDDPAASVDNTGLATGVAAGIAKIRATLGDVTAAPTSLTVKPPPPSVNTPLLSGGTTVSGLTGESQASVQVLVNGLPRGPTTPATAGTWTIVIAPALVAGDIVAARQAVNGVQSDVSQPVIVSGVNSAPIVNVNGPLSAGHDGRIVVGHDVNTLGTAVAGATEARFAVNLARWLTRSNAGSILAVESAPGDGTRNYAAVVKTALANAGFNVTYVSNPATVSALTFTDLKKYDAIFAGITWPQLAAISASTLTQYVNAGGGVYMYGGVGPAPASEAAFLNPFLNPFGLSFDVISYNGLVSVNITSTHAIFDGLTGLPLGSGNGQDIHDLNTNINASIIQFSGQHGVYAVVNPPSSTVGLSASFTDDGLPTGASLTAVWSQVSGPTGSAPVIFNPSTFTVPDVAGVLNPANTNATFTDPGTYVLRLTASDTSLSSSADLIVTIGNGTPALASINPSSGQQGQQDLSVDITGQSTHFVPGTTKASFGAAITVVSLTVNSATSATALITIDSAATLGTRTVTVTTGAEIVSVPNGFSVLACTPPSQPPTVNAGQNQLGPIVPDNLFISEWQSNKVVEYTPSGQYVRDFVPAGSPLNGAGSIHFGPDGNLYVTDSVSARKFDGVTGSYLGGFATGLQIGSQQGDIIFDAAGNGFIAEPLANRISEYSSVGVPLRTFTSGISTPQGLIFLPTGHLLVTNTYDGIYRNTITELDTATGATSTFATGLGEPIGIAVGPDGRYYVANYTFAAMYGGTNPDTVQVVPSAGGVAHTFATGTDGAAFLLFSDNKLYVTSFYDSRIYSFAGNTGQLLDRFQVPVPTREVLGIAARPSIPSLAFLNGSVTTTSSCGGVSNIWSKVSGPGTVTFADAHAPITTATFSATGTYVLRLSATNAAGSTSSDVTINAAVNHSPIVYAGPNQTVAVNAPLVLNGTATDDGLPSGGAFSVAWSKVSGPGTVAFADVHAPNTTATFTDAGTYILRLTADDSQLTSRSDVMISVSASPKVVSVVPASAPQGQQNLAVTITGQSTHLSQGSTSASFGPGINVVSLTVNSGTTATAVINIDLFTTMGGRTVTLTTGAEIAALVNGFTVVSGNRAPIVDAGPDIALADVGTTPVNGTVTDDGLPLGAPLSIAWSVVEQVPPVIINSATRAIGDQLGPGWPPLEGTFWQTTFQLPTQPVSDALLTFETAEVQYQDNRILINGILVGYMPLNEPDALKTFTLVIPATVLRAGSNVFRLESASIPGNYDDVRFRNIQLSAGQVTFSSPQTAHTQATFTIEGRYTLRLTANDTEFTSSDDAVVTVGANRAPVVGAGPNQTVTLQTGASLNGFAADDGLPLGSTLSVTWSKVSGPGTVSFADPLNPITTASFGAAGVYVLQLAASDSILTRASQVTITVTASSAPAISFVNPNFGQQGQGGPVTISGVNTHFAQGTTQVDLGPGVTVTSTTVTCPTCLSVQVTIADNAPTGSHTVTVTTGAEIATLASGFTVQAGAPSLTSLSQASGQRGQAFPVTITGKFTHFVQGQTQVSLGAGIAVSNVTVATPTSVSAQVAIDATATTGTRTLTVTTGAEVVSAANVFSVTTAATLTRIDLTPAGTVTLTKGQTVQFAAKGTFSDNSVQDPLSGVTWSSDAPNVATVTTAGLATGVTAGTANISASKSGVQSTATHFVVKPLPVGLLVPIFDNDPAVSGGLAEPGATVQLFVNGTPRGAPVLADVSGNWTMPMSALTPALVANDVVTARQTVNGVQSDDSATAVVVGVLRIVSVVPNIGTQGQQNLAVTITGQLTHFVQGLTQVTFAGTSVTVNSVTVSSATKLIVNVSIAANANSAPRFITVTTGAEVVSLNNAFTVQPATNQAPVITIAPSWSVTLPSRLLLNYTVTDDGLPIGGALTTTWEKISGPGNVGFLAQTPVSISAGFDQSGPYILRITATDTQFTVHQDVTVNVAGAPANPPTVSIATPTDGTEITGPVTVVGSVASPALASWTLEFRLQTEPTFRTLATGTTPVTNAALGTLDPTLLLNGLGLLQLRATDAGGQTSTFGPISVVITQNQKIGNFTVSFNDLTVPVAGLPIQIVRTYDSRNKANGDFGIGWTLDVNSVRVDVSGGALGDNWNAVVLGNLLPTYCIQPAVTRVVTITFADGTVFQFQPTLNPSCQQLVPLDETSIGFTPISTTPPNASLIVIGNTQPFIGGAQPGPVNLLDLDEATTYDPDLYQLTMPDGRVLRISRLHGLQTISDPNGNTLTVSPNGIIHSSGKSVTFLRDNANRITQITDPSGHTIGYTYDANGDLASVRDAVNNTTTFTYNTTHGLLTITDPRGVQPIKNVYDNSGRLIQHVDAFGNTINYTYNLDTRQDIVTDRLGHITVNEYDTRGNVVLVTDALGGVTTRTYDARNNLLTEINPLGRTRSYTYDANNNRLSDTDPVGNTTQYTYNARNQVLTVTDPLGHVTTNSYNANGDLLSTRDANSQTTTYTYDARGLRTSMVDPLGNSTTYAYDGSGNLTTQTDALGHATTYTYDGNGNRLTETKTQTTAGGADPVLTQYQYDAQNRLIKTTFADGGTTQTIYNSIGKAATTIDQLGRHTSYEYDLMGRLTKTTFADGSSESSSYDAEGERTASTDRAGRPTTYTYDPLKRLTQTTYADGATTSTAYDLAGEVTSVTDARGNATHYAYDGAGRRLSVTDALGHITSSANDAVGNQISMKDANGSVTQYLYDAVNRRLRTTYADATFDSVTFDALGRTLSKTDQAGLTTQFRYDALGRLITVIDALSQQTQYAYDELGNRTTQTDANGHVTRFAYDALGRRTGRTLPLGMTETSAYDAAGNLTNKTDFNGRTTTYAYDLLNRLTTKTPDARFAAPTVGFSYSPTGQRTQMVDASGTTTYTYDVRDRLATKATPAGTLMYGYDTTGNLASLQSSNAGGTSVTYAYDVLNRLTTVTDPRLTPGTTTYAYDNVGNLASFKVPNQVTHTYTYNTLNHLTNLAVTNGASISVASYAYTLGPAGNRTAVAELNGRNVNYSYDSLYRLTVETISGAAGGTTTYAYDSVANRLSKSSPNTGLTFYVYDANDRLTSDTYDNNGNTAASGGNVFSYDFENHLTEMSNGAPAAIVYDGDGNRAAKTTGGVTTKYLADDRNLTSYTQVLEELSGGVVQRVYTYGLNRISQRQAGGISFYAYDGHGNVRILTDLTGAVTDRYDYDAFGNIVTQTGTTPNLYLYSGEQNDPNLGLYYLRARYLSQSTGRFWTPDTVEGIPLDPLSLQRYIYAAADPVDLRDPSGHLTLTLEETAVVSAGLAYLASITIPRIDFAGTISKAKAVVEEERRRQQIFRSATGTPDSVTPRPRDVQSGGLSFWDSVDKIDLGSKYIEVDPLNFRALMANYDQDPPGHVSVRPDSDAALASWAASRGTGVVHPLTLDVLNAITYIGIKR